MVLTREYFDRFFRMFDLSHPMRMAVYGAVVGIISGFGAVGFFYALEWTTHMVMGGLAGHMPITPAGENLFEHMAPGPTRPWLFFLLPAFGGLLSGLLVYRFAPEAEGHGTDAMIATFHHKQGLVRPRVPIVKTLATICVLGTGGCGGREGPIAQIGSGFGSWFAQKLHLGVRQRRILLLAGVGGGLAAIFRSPLGGALTAVEVLYKEDFESEALIPTVVSSVIGYTIFCSVFGYGHIFEIPHLAFREAPELLIYMVLALVCLPTGMLYVWVFHSSRRRFAALRIPRHVKPMLGGLILGIIGLVLPEIYGGGWGQIQLALLGKLSLTTMIILVFAKMVGTSLSIGSGGSGGVFGPTLVIGGMLGGAVGTVGNMLFPEVVTQPGAYVLVGMAAFFAGVANAPVGALVMVSEMTGGYDLIAPLLLVSTVAMLLSRKTSIYENQLEDRFHSPAHMGDVVTNILAEIKVKQCATMLADLPLFPASTRLDEMPDWVFEPTMGIAFVKDRKGKLVGFVPGSRFQTAPGSAAMRRLVILFDIMEKYTPVCENDDLFSALAELRRRHQRVLPVEDARGAIKGYIEVDAIMDAYANEITRRKEGSE